MKLRISILAFLTLFSIPLCVWPQGHGELQELITNLNHADPKVRADAAVRLGLIGPTAKQAVPALTKVLGDQDPNIAAHAANSLSKIGSAAVPALRDLIRSAEETHQKAGELSPEEMNKLAFACMALGAMGPDAKEAVPELTSILHLPYTMPYVMSAKSLGSIGPAAKGAIPRLKEVANDDTVDFLVRVESVQSLGGIGGDAIPTLLEILKQGDPKLQALAVQSIGRVGPNGVGTMPHLIEVLKDREKYADPDARREAAYVLGSYGQNSRRAIPDLVNALNDPEQRVRLAAAKALGNIASNLQQGRRIDAIDQLESVHKSMSESGDPAVKEQAGRVRSAILSLNIFKRKTPAGQFINWIDQHRYVTGAIAAYLLLILLLVFLLFKRPLTLLKINDALAPYTDFTLPSWLGGMKVPVRYLLVIGFFHYHRRVLDAWVAQRVQTLREEFAEKPTVKARQVFVPMPVLFNGDVIQKLTVEDLRPTFRKGKNRLLIHGEGGSGKTSIACQIAMWAMADDATQRLLPHLMLPILLEQEVEPNRADGKDSLVEAIRGQLQALIGDASAVPEGLHKKLLENRRVLVIVDRFSEWGEPSRQAVRPSSAGFAVNSLIITSRKDEPFGDLPKATIQPIRIEGNRLSQFMEAYLTLRGVSGLFDDPEKFGAYRKLSIMVGERNITVLLAKLYAEHVMIAAKENKAGALPENIPELMLTYVNELNNAVKDNKVEDRRVHRAIKLIAWECLRKTYRPTPISRDRASELLGDDAELLITYMDERLRVIQTVGAGRDQVRFTLDPLAEYYAGMHLVETHKDEGQSWRDFFSTLDSEIKDTESVKDFLLALRDCCLAFGKNLGTPAFVPIELSRRSNHFDAQEDIKRSEYIQWATLVLALLSNGSVDREKLNNELKDFSDEEVRASLNSLVDKRWITEDGGSLSLPQEDGDQFYRTLTEIYRFVINNPVPVQLFDGEYYVSHVNEEFVRAVTEIQGGLPLSSDEVQSCISILKISPGALARAIQPDPFIVNHRVEQSLKDHEQINLIDKHHFLNSLSEALVEDFVNPALTEFLLLKKGLREISRAQKLLLKSDKGIALQVETEDRKAIVKFVWEGNESGKYVSVGLRLDDPEPWERADNGASSNN